MTIACPDCSGYLWQHTPVVDGAVRVDLTSYGCLCCGHKSRAYPEASPDRPGKGDNDTGPLRSGRVVRPETAAPGTEAIPLGGGPGAADRGGAP